MERENDYDSPHSLPLDISPDLTIPGSGSPELNMAAEYIARIFNSQSSYEILGIQADVDKGIGVNKKKLKENFMKMAKNIHPDKCLSSDARAAFSRLRAAYEEIQNDLNSPKPVAVMIPKLELKPRRHAATLTSRVLRGVASGSMSDGGGRAEEGINDIATLRKFCSDTSGYDASAIGVDVGSVRMGANKNEVSSAITPRQLIDSLSPSPPTSLLQQPV